MSKRVRFTLARADVLVLLSDLENHLPAVLYAELQKQLLAAAARLDADPAGTADVRLADEHAAPFREWLDRAEARTRARYPTKADVFARVRRSEH